MKQYNPNKAVQAGMNSFTVVPSADIPEGVQSRANGRPNYAKIVHVANAIESTMTSGTISDLKQVNILDGEDNIVEPLKQNIQLQDSETLELILFELRKMNLHLELMTGEQITEI